MTVFEIELFNFQGGKGGGGEKQRGKDDQASNFAGE